MVETVKTWVQKVVGPLVVAAIMGLFGAGLFTRDAVHSLDRRVSTLEKWSEKTDGNRFLKSDGILERVTRETADKLHDEKMRALEAENIRIWASIRKHIERGEHQGADYRLRALEKHVDESRAAMP